MTPIMLSILDSRKIVAGSMLQDVRPGMLYTIIGISTALATLLEMPVKSLLGRLVIVGAYHENCVHACLFGMPGQGNRLQRYCWSRFRQ